MYGTQYAFVAGGIILMSFVLANVYLPVFHNMGLTSNYEVIRFNIFFKLHFMFYQ